MAKFLLHQTRDGSPVGVFNEDGDHYYFQNLAPANESYGVSVMESKGPDVTWDDWTDQLASKSPSPNAMWDEYTHPDVDLESVLMDARKDTGFH